MVNWLKGRIDSFGHALRGIASLLAGEPNARIHLLATVVVLMLGLLLDVNRGDWLALLLIIAVVWLAEGMNTALEHLADAAVPEFHPLVRKAKDVAAGTVLVTAVVAVILGLLVFLPYLVSWGQLPSP